MSFVSPRASMFPSASPRGTLRSRGNKTHCFPWDQSLSAYCKLINPHLIEISILSTCETYLFAYVSNPIVSATTSISTLEPITGRKSETAIPRNIDDSRIGKTIRRWRYNTKIRLTMLCLSGFELYSRWVSLNSEYACFFFIKTGFLKVLHKLSI